MRNVLAAILAALILVAGCGESGDQVATGTPDVDAGDALDALFEEHFERNLHW